MYRFQCFSPKNPELQINFFKKNMNQIKKNKIFQQNKIIYFIPNNFYEKQNLIKNKFFSFSSFFN